uniref:Uncharacterized protein n=1 Tax=Eptatretus burgeri TaxID=7764 RepID=A0A8C4PZJ8_EPTBU
MEERQKRRQAESELRRREEEEEEQRIAQEQCIMQKQRQDEFDRKCQQDVKKEQLRKQIEQQHKSMHRAPELASQAKRELREFQNNHGGQGTGDPQHVLTECRTKGRDEPSLTSSLSVEKSVQTEEGDARVPPQGPISARKPGRTSTAPGGSRSTSRRAMPRVREQPKPTGHRGVDRRASVPKEPCSTQQQKPLRATKGLATQITPGREHSAKTTERSTVRSCSKRCDGTRFAPCCLVKLRGLIQF